MSTTLQTLVKRKRGRPPNPNKKLIQKPKKVKKYEEIPTTKSVRNAINAKKNRDLAKKRLTQMQMENDALREENAQLMKQIATLASENLARAETIAKLDGQKLDHFKRVDLILNIHKMFSPGPDQLRCKSSDTSDKEMKREN